MKKFYTYVLRSLKDDNKYIGSTSNLEKRLHLHNNGKVLSTKSRIPFKLIYYESFETLNEARWRERKFKRSHDVLRRAMRDSKEFFPGKEAAGPEGLWPGGR